MKKTVMILPRVFALSILALVLLSPARLAAETAASRTGVFFEALYDVPVMPGLEELKDQAMMFDKPGGRIASVVAASKTLKTDDVARFYAETLPQLGWQKSSENQYVRGNDKLSMDVSRKGALTIVHFALAPGR